ncbi:MAG: hypothetical protein HYZ28_01570 [Myxococcales bacterium]|nr:hypothetical protein [Myxococcales bacterium]
MRKLFVPLALGALLSVPFACDLEKTGNQLAAQKVMVATMLGTPPLEVKPAALLGLDASFDASFPADSGISSDGGMITLPPTTAAFVFFGTRSADSLDTPPEPVANATVSTHPAGGASVVLNNDGKGSYSKTSLQDPSMKYESGKSYEFTAVLGGESFVGEVQNAPPIERISEFHPVKGYVDRTAGQPFTFTRPDPPAGQERTLGFVTVFPLSENGQKGEPTYTNIPTTPLEFLKLIATPGEWKQTVVTVPGSAFPAAKKTYVVVLQSVKIGGPKSDNLFTGSAILAGTADAAVVRTQ